MSFVVVSFRRSFITSQEGVTRLCKFNAGLKSYSHEAVFAGKSFSESLPSPHKTCNQPRLLPASPPTPPPPPPLPPLPPQPHHRRRNRCPCGECFVRRKFITPGECSFHAKTAVAVGVATPAIAITSGESSHQRLQQPLLPPPPPKSRRLRLLQRTLLPRRCRQSYYSWGSGSVTEGGARRRYLRERRQASGGGRRTTTLRRRRDRRSQPQA